MIGSLRLLLAFMVVISHTHGYPFGTLPDPGLSAIVAFFFLSGFLMPATLERNYADDSVLRQTRRYLINRFLRIFPVYWFALLLTWIILWLGAPARDLYDLSSSISYLQNWVLLGLNQSGIWHMDQRFIGPAWTLDVELQYYLIAPALLFATKATRIALSAILFASGISLYYLIRPTGIDDIDRSLVPWFIFFASGFCLYWFREQFAQTKIKKGLIAGSLAFFLLSIVIAFISAPASHWLLACALISLIAKLLLDDRKSGRLDDFLGNLSYPVFILHAVVNTTGVPAAIATHILPNSLPVLTLTTIALTMPLAIFAEVVISRPIDRYRKRLQKQRSS